MPIGLHNLSSSKNESKKRRLGRGLGSGRGAKAGRGQKGQKSRSGASGFDRLGMRKLMLATPKLRGFKSLNPEVSVVNVEDIARVYTKGEDVNPTTLSKKGLIPATEKRVKILGNGEIDVAVTVQNCAVSKSAAEKILAAGGKISA